VRVKCSVVVPVNVRLPCKDDDDADVPAVHILEAMPSLVERATNPETGVRDR
jgi:hypothetical protein